LALLGERPKALTSLTGISEYLRERAEYLRGFNYGDGGLSPTVSPKVLSPGMLRDVTTLGIVATACKRDASPRSVTAGARPGGRHEYTGATVTRKRLLTGSPPATSRFVGEA